MAASTRRDLFLQVNADVTPLTAASKAGRTALLTLGSAADDVAAEVEKAFRNLGGGSIEASAKSMERSFESTFANIRRNAAAVMDAPTGQAAMQIIDAAGAQRAAAAADTQAAALRRTADAAAVVAQRAGEAGLAERTLAVSFEVAARQAEEQAAAMRTQAGIISSVAAQVKVASEGEVDAQDQVVKSHTRMGASGMIAEHVIRSMSDSIAAGQSPARALGMEMGRVTEAITMFAQQSNATEGKMGAFASFMGGPWGLAFSVGVAVILPLVEHLYEAGSASDELNNKITSLESALSAEKFGTDAARKALEEYNAEKKKAAENDSNATQISLKLARAGLQNALAIREQAKAMADKLLMQGSSDPNGGLQGAVGAARGYQAQADNAAKDVEDARQAIRNLQIDDAGQAAKAAADPIEAIRQKYKHLADAAAEAARKNDNLAASLKGLQISYSLAEKKEIAAEQARQQHAHKETRDNRQFGNTISAEAAATLIRNIGGKVNSDVRSYAKQKELYDSWVAQGKPADNPTARPGTSAHEHGTALDVQMAPGMSIAKIKEAFAAEGVALTKAIVERGHYHVEWGKKGPSQETLDRRDQSAADKLTRTDAAFADMKSRAQEEYLQLTRGQVTDIATAADIDRQRVEEERKRLNAAAQARADEAKSYDKNAQSQADGIIALNNANAQIKAQAIIRKEITDSLDKQLTDERTAIGGQLVLLQLQGELTIGTKERRANALAQLAKEEEDRRAVANKLMWSEDPADVKLGQQQNDQIDREHDLRVAGINKQTQSPMERYKEQLTQNVGDLNEALDGVKANALQGLETGLEGILDGTKSVAQGFREMAGTVIAQLERIAIQKLILHFIGGGLFADGNVPGQTKAAATGLVPGFATGIIDGSGIIRGPGTGRSDSILAMMGRDPIRISNGESIMTEAATKRWGPVLKQMNEGRMHAFAGGYVSPAATYMRSVPTAEKLRQAGPATAPITFDLRGAVMTQDLLDQMNTISARHAMVSMVGGSQMAQQEIAEQRSQAIP